MRLIATIWSASLIVIGGISFICRRRIRRDTIGHWNIRRRVRNVYLQISCLRSPSVYVRPSVRSAFLPCISPTVPCKCFLDYVHVLKAELYMDAVRLVCTAKNRLIAWRKTGRGMAIKSTIRREWMTSQTRAICCYVLDENSWCRRQRPTLHRIFLVCFAPSAKRHALGDFVMNDLLNANFRSLQPQKKATECRRRFLYLRSAIRPSIYLSIYAS